jgi:UPF0716 protein FxsA
MPVLLILILLPLIEIALFVAVGGWIGVWGVLALVVLGALLGVALLRGRLARVPVLLRAGGDPARLLAEGAMTAVGAVLLIAPGFLTDVVGLALLLPPVQRAVARRFAGSTRTTRWQGTVIDGDYVVRDPQDRDSDRNGEQDNDDPPRLRPPPRH